MKTPLFILSLFISLVGMHSCTAQQEPDLTKAFLVDVRTPEEFAQGSAEGAVNIPLDEVQNRIAEFQGKSQIVLFCRSGNRSAQAESILKANHVTNVSNGGTWQMVDKKIKESKKAH